MLNILGIVLLVANVIWAFGNFFAGQYALAMLNTFASGVILLTLFLNRR
jgi:hypothetical protein